MAKKIKRRIVRYVTGEKVPDNAVHIASVFETIPKLVNQTIHYYELHESK